LEFKWLKLEKYEPHERSLKVIENGTIGKFGHGFLFAFHKNAEITERNTNSEPKKTI